MSLDGDASEYFRVEFSDIKGSKMLVIRREQIDVLSAYMLDGFVSRMAIRLRADYARETEKMNDEDLRKFIKANIERANAFSVRADDNLASFLELATLCGADFFEMPGYEWAKTILEDDMIAETEKMNRINEYQIFDEDLGAG